jgi:hypothetical protein
MLASVITSACKPAPPLGSVAAKASTIGGNGDDADGESISRRGILVKGGVNR